MSSPIWYFFSARKLVVMFYFWQDLATLGSGEAQREEERRVEEGGKGPPIDKRSIAFEMSWFGYRKGGGRRRRRRRRRRKDLPFQSLRKRDELEEGL